MPRGAKTSTPVVVVGKGIPKLLPTLKIVVDDEDGRFRGRKLVERGERKGSSRRQCVVLHRDAGFKPPLPSLSPSARGNWPSFSSAGRENAFRQQQRPLFASPPLVNEGGERKQRGKLFFFLLLGRARSRIFLKKSLFAYRIIFREFFRVF